MRSISKLSMLATFIILCAYTQFTEARSQTKGRLVLKTNPAVFATKPPTPLIALDNPCCPDRPPCCFEELRRSNRESVDNIEGVKNIVDLGILVDLPIRSSIVMEEASIEIYSNEDKLVFSTEAKCDGCGKTLSLKTMGNS